MHLREEVGRSERGGVVMQAIALQPQFWIIPVVAGLLLSGGVVLLVFGIRANRAGGLYSMDGDGRMISGAMVTFFGVAALVTWLVLLIPYSSQYWMFYRLTGDVQSVTRTLNDGSGELTKRPVVAISGFDRPVVVDDSRIYSYVGERVDFTCSIEWVPYGGDRVNCFIAGVAP